MNSPLSPPIGNLASHHLRITLRTSDCRIGIRFHPRRAPFQFDRDGDGETVEADIELLTNSSQILANTTITGEEWRSIDDSGDLDQVLVDVHDGADLSFAIAAQSDWFRNHYKCPCGNAWRDEWSCMCDDRCGTCNTSVSPHTSEQLRP